LYIKNVIESIEEDLKDNNTRKMYQTINQFKKEVNINLTWLGTKKENWQWILNRKQKYGKNILIIYQSKELIKIGNREINEVEVEETYYRRCKKDSEKFKKIIRQLELMEYTWN